MASDVHADIIRCVLNNTDDPFVAARMADQLGAEMTFSTPRVTFPTSWIRQHLGDFEPGREFPAREFLVNNCADPALLAELLASESSLLVRRAIIRNPHLPAEARQSSSLRSWTLPSETLPLRERLTVLFDQWINGYQSNPRPAEYELMKKWLRDGVDVTDANWALLELAQRNFHLSISSFLHHCYALRPPDPLDPFTACSLDPAQVLAAVPAYPHRQRIANSLVHTLLAYPGPSVPVDVDVAKLLTDGFVRLHLEHRTNALAPLLSSFTPAAIDFLLDQELPWLRALNHQQLSPAQGERLLDYFATNGDVKDLEFFAIRRLSRSLMDPLLIKDAMTGRSFDESLEKGERDELLHLVFDPRQMARALLDAFDTLKANVTRVIIGCITSPNDPLLAETISRAPTDLFMEYLTGGWRTRDHSLILPSPSEVSGLVACLPKTAFIPSSLRGLLYAPAEYINALLDHLPGIAPRLLELPGPDRLVYERLSHATPDIDYAISQFEMSQYTTLAKVCSTLAALDRAVPPASLAAKNR